MMAHGTCGEFKLEPSCNTYRWLRVGLSTVTAYLQYAPEAQQPGSRTTCYSRISHSELFFWLVLRSANSIPRTLRHSGHDAIVASDLKTCCGILMAYSNVQCTQSSRREWHRPLCINYSVCFPPRDVLRPGCLRLSCRHLLAPWMRRRTTSGSTLPTRPPTRSHWSLALSLVLGTTSCF